MKKYNTSEIMKRAHFIHKNFNLSFSYALKESWAIAKAPTKYEVKSENQLAYAVVSQRKALKAIENYVISLNKCLNIMKNSNKFKATEINLVYEKLAEISVLYSYIGKNQDCQTVIESAKHINTFYNDTQTYYNNVCHIINNIPTMPWETDRFNNPKIPRIDRFYELLEKYNIAI